MKRGGVLFTIMVLNFFLLLISCQNKDGKEAVIGITTLTDSEVNVEKIEEAIGCSFDILKTETHGYTTIHKFLWICLDYDSDRCTLENLSLAIIKENIGQRPGLYHSFTIHFFNKEELCRTIEDSPPFAKAEYLPEGGWVEVGRKPINEYENYKLSVTFHNQ